MSQARDYYSVLGVLPSTDIIVIRAAFRALAHKYHPDKWRGNKAESEARMRELNEAYEVLSNDEQRKKYDSQRKQPNDNSFDYDDETMRSAFGEAEQVQASDWAIAIDYCPDLSEIHQRLAKTSDKLAFAYRTLLLESKDFKDRRKIADEMEETFLKRYFGSDPKIIWFAKSLCHEGNKAGAKELNRVISVLGKKVDAGEIIKRLSDKFNITTSPPGTTSPGGDAPDPVQLAHRVIMTQDFRDAKNFLASLGGIIYPDGGLVFNKKRKCLVLNNQWTKFLDDDHLTRWVVDHLAPRYK
jgi:curved DNA-binding protein CbpA